jgi:hypothetical protein
VSNYLLGENKWVDVKIKAKEFLDRDSFTAVMDDRGRITIPASVRRKLRVRFSSKILCVIKTLKLEEEISS